MSKCDELKAYHVPAEMCGLVTMALARTWMKCRLLKPSEWSKVWQKVERLCRAKAEEYK